MSRKKIIIISAICAVLGICVLLFPYVSPFIFDSVDVGFVNVLDGSAFLVRKNVETEILAPMVLKQGDIIYTTTGEANVILFESEVVRLSPYSKVQLTEMSDSKILLTQLSGNLSHSVNNLNGNRTYIVKLPETTATATGTQFVTTIGGGYESHYVSEGQIFVEDSFTDLSVGILEKSIKRSGEPLVLEPLSAEEKKILAREVSQTIQTLQGLRQAQIAELTPVVELVKKKYNLTDEDLQIYLAKIDSGEIDMKDVVANAPISNHRVDKFIQTTSNIKDSIKTLSELETQ
ncbi:MAG TPA: hypothetical protein VK158_03490 [Acidobacteriota bacterium]|nr:hypothetical protein [Acidobacteriota bacterium]